MTKCKLTESLKKAIETIPLPELTLVQIGANNRKDHIFRIFSKYATNNKWICLLVEPLDLPFRKLMDRYSNQRKHPLTSIYFEKSAVSYETGTSIMYKIIPDEGFKTEREAGKADKRASLIKSR